MYDYNKYGLPYLPSDNVTAGGDNKEYGQRANPPGFHDGIDISGNFNIRAIADGVVTYVQKNGWHTNNISEVNSAPNLVYLAHSDGVASWYYHFANVVVNMGQKVKKGDVLGLSGETGYTFGVHCHFMTLINGVKCNPRDILDFNNPQLYINKTDMTWNDLLVHFMQRMLPNETKNLNVEQILALWEKTYKAKMYDFLNSEKRIDTLNAFSAGTTDVVRWSVLDCPFEYVNPFISNTKVGVVPIISNNNNKDVIKSAIDLLNPLIQ